ncbi:MAG: fibrobacter succinogenes major paralogous domain-containing protein [Sediminibacterium sp.]|nr:fibrobacter succinogenes major paralogous domain-containing protein [Sediminibacterium sp.]
MKRITLLSIFLAFVTLLQAQVKDKSGNSYKTVKIGAQTWMAQNLNTSHFRNGDPIPEAKSDAAWEKAGTEGKPAWCYYEYNAENGPVYGKLYNWYAVNDSRGLAPAGCHVPTNAEWDLLAKQLGGFAAATRKLKSASGWSNDLNGSNESGFNGLPGGILNTEILFTELGYYGYWWSSTEEDKEVALNRNLAEDQSTFEKATVYKKNGLSVRCLKN